MTRSPAGGDDPVTPRLRASIVICTRDRPALLERCLRALSGQASALSSEVIVVDNASRDDSASLVADRSGARYVAEPTAGQNRARNTGSRHAQGGILVFTDDDTVPEPDWLERLLAEFDDPTVTAVTGRIESTPDAPPDLAIFPRKERVVIDQTTPEWFALTNFGGVGNGANMAFRRSALTAVRGFDERLGLGGAVTSNDEHEVFFRIVEQGGRIVYTPAAVVNHRPPPRDIAERATLSLTGTIAYMLLLLVECPRHRRPLVRYALEGLLRKKRAWRTPGPPSPVRESRSPLMVCAARAVGQYLRARRVKGRAEPLAASAAPRG